MDASGLIIGGRQMPCSHPVFNWDDHGMEFRPGDGARRRTKKTIVDLFVWHWTGGTGDMESLYRVLDRRDLGVEFGIDRDGTIYQFADPLLVDTYDAGPYNRRSVGCEVVNYGFTMKGREAPKRDADRGTYSTVQNKRTRVFARFYPAQLKAAFALGCAVSDAIETIPKCIPTDRRGVLFPNTMSTKRLAEFRGHLGHYHLTTSKSDPGSDLLGYMLESGFKSEYV